MKQKNLKVQILRAIAIIAVVMIHTCPMGEFQVFVRPFINFAVATFLFLSGYLTNIENSDWKSFYKKRISRVIIPYIIWTLLYTTVHCIKDGFHFKSYIVNLLTTKSTETLYYIFVYIQFVILTPLLGKLARSKYHWVGWLIAPISVMLKYYWVFSGTTPNKCISALWDISCLGWFTYYYLGLLLGNKIIEKQYNIKKLSLLYGISIIIQMLEGYQWFLVEESNCGAQLKLSSILTSSIFILMAYWYINNEKRQASNKLLLMIGDYSFGIYMSHVMILKLFRIFPFWQSIPFGVNSLIILIVTTICVALGQKICGEKLSRWLGMN